jgi:nucleoside-diphosphate-sugar epimerase
MEILITGATGYLGIVADRALGEPGNRIFDEDHRPEPVPEKTARVAIDHLVLDAATRNVRSAVISPTMVYGRGRGLHVESVQVPALLAQARKSGVARYIGRGLNVWSNVHVDDVVDLYALALERAPAGSKLEQLRSLIERGQTRPVVDSQMLLSDMASAHERLERGGVRGKLVLDVAGSWRR